MIRVQPSQQPARTHTRSPVGEPVQAQPGSLAAGLNPMELHSCGTHSPSKSQGNPKVTVTLQ